MDESAWEAKTEELVESHPLKREDLKRIVSDSWNHILSTNVGGYVINRDIFPRPQVIGFLLHEVLCLEIARLDPESWKCGEDTYEKDIVNLRSAKYSIEAKTSSNRSRIFGNRNYAQTTSDPKKSKSGYYLVVNFEKFTRDMKGMQPKILRVRFGWIDHEDWFGQKSESGQQASLARNIMEYKLVEI